MKAVKKNIRIIGIMILLLFVLSACGNNERSSPEATFKNYFSLVQDMEFEESYEFMNFDLSTQFKAKMGEDLDEEVPEEIKSLKSYQEYTSEVAKLYKKIDYEIVDIVNEGSIGSDPEFEARDYLVRVTVPNIDQIIEKSAMNSIGHLLGALFTGEIDLEAYDEIYRSLVEDIKNEDIEEEIIEGIIGIREYTKIALRTPNSSMPERKDDNDFDIVWAISYMDENIFNALTPMGDINSIEASDELFDEYDNQETEDIVEDEEVEKELEEDVETEEERVEEYWDRARDELERTDEPVEESEKHMSMLAKDMEELFEVFGQDFDEFEGDYTSSPEFAKSIAGQTEPWIGDNINMAIEVGYEMDPESAEWYYSDTDEVYQFAVGLKSEDSDKEDIVISGNYNKDVRVFKVFRINGDLSFPELLP